MSNNNEAENDHSVKELARLDSFVNASPGSEYTIDQKEQELCRQNVNGQSECIKLNLEYTQMFSEMQNLGFFCALPMDPKKIHMECRRV
ncbi:hypothetical protein CU097_015793 [Rhizopus azygosporus]|uniref:Uncharacterized protein n=3 Tax=Rhizopus TaxID=4842 RepID=A0A2G4SN29_RHIZD|nr:uncharacterized protein RHIMIDRAFT_239659 [Rhizopus microsporus ATCC 52813]ORE06935.1 hypothetical protein BCV72DRAFT_291112 [Rhizopus microsporus var. microsporus]RCI00597.1 hypothetical protein CU097_015793 [Rhizopus azygosporus]CEG72246.1 hypothetical protein RMATCC62417_07833 [Rhizopus microsporus]PHZ10179.1 hypothetical protein RHIMIDRAFT_239659 [Rhizopus microsporus ATCC 52813]CEG77418.1 hypothetical protein RMATCC62417_12175 [Rhizopus microsporus]